MKQNMGAADRIIRLILAAVIGVLYFSGVITGTVGIILAVLGVIFLVTGATGICLIYLPFKLSTKKS